MSASRNDITGDQIKSRPSNRNYAKNYNRIFKKSSKTAGREHKKRTHKAGN